MPRSARPPAARDTQAATLLRVRQAVLGMTRPLEARISPDGCTVAVTVSGPGHTGVLLVPADGSAARGPNAAREAAPVVPHGPDGSPDPAPRHSPRWLPDSRTLLLITGPRPDAAGRPELTAWDTRTGRLRTLVSVPGDVEDLLLSDDGTEVLLLVAEEGAERDGMHLGLPVRLGPRPHPESFRPGHGRRRLLHGALPRPGAGARAATAPVRLRDASPRGLTVWNAAWRGGATVVATVSAESLPAGYYHARLVSVDLADGTTRTLHTPAGQLAAPALTADGRHAAVVEGISIVAGRPVLVDLADGTVTVPTGPEDTTWLVADPRDPRRLLLAGWAGTGSRITGAPVDPGAPGAAAPTVHWQDEAVLSGPAAQPALTLSADGASAAAVLEAPGRPPQAVVAPTAGPGAWSWRPVTALNPAAARGSGDFADLARVRTRRTSWTSADGRRLHGLLLDAPAVRAPRADRDPAGAGRAASTARPLAVLVHGGPSWLWSAGYAPDDVLGMAPALAAAGWLVLLPNLRGSSGYGLDHAHAVVGDFGGGDLADLLTAVTALTSAGEAAPEQTAVLGHSYGGYLAAVAATRTSAFRAAVVISAPTDWLSFVHTSVIGGGYESAYRIGDARTAAGRAALIDRSPVFAVPGPGTPVLLLHGEQDRVTPVAQAHELYRALACRAAAPVELHVYPDEGHEFTEPAHLLDAAGRADAWLTRHVLGAVAPAAAPTPDRPADHGTPRRQAT
ncbi:alpha/beta fold hydrolase [Actinacidiphila paucisporea]|uniref:Acyl-peptide hydrolase n=1 Tax=Actinacidiphila paucisporea TaxID=310782 RepID=A0A1M7QVN4_9ACTN|nr:alpha/beta fold hydrolase [Actinacidiphila paucisporea]SHN36035.1 Dipeptidyl aminopeptidase/acylaminoacyl peptidase [Actinacidiphila paucisporea]